MIEVIKTTGNHIAYTTTDKSIILGDEDLSINLKNRQKDEAVTIDVCEDINGELTMGTAAGQRYVAQVEIPARTYTEAEEKNPAYIEGGVESEYIVKREPVPFDINICIIYLWGLEA